MARAHPERGSRGRGLSPGGRDRDGRHTRAPAHRVGAGLDERRRSCDRARRGPSDLWRHLQASRQELAARERADLILETQLSVAADIQRRLLPALPFPADGIEWAASLHSAGRIGGDLDDIVALAPARWLLLVADVSGKGIPAAMALGFLRASFRAVARAHDRPAEVVASLSALVYEAWGGVPYVTCIVARLDATGDSLTWANAGHPSGIVTGQGTPRLLDASGPPVGLLTDATWVDQSVSFEPGDRLVLVTDGVTEALGDGEPSPTDRIYVFELRSTSRGPGAGHV